MSSPSSSSDPAIPSAYSHFKIFIPSFPAPYIAQITITNPKSLNSIPLPSFHELPPLLSLLNADPQIRVILLTGHGTTFSSGLDLASFPSLLPTLSQQPPSTSPSSPSSTSTTTTDPSLHLHQTINSLQTSVRSLSLSPKPTISLILGPCLGGALSLASLTSIRLSSPTATYSVGEINIGIAADIGALTTLPTICSNASWVHDVCLTGRVFSAQEAEKNGLVQVVEGGDVMEKGMEMAREIVGKSEGAVRATKDVLALSGGEEGWGRVVGWNVGLLQGEGVRRGVESVRRKMRKGGKREKAKL